MNIESSNIGLHFDNSYARLPDVMLSRLNPMPVKKPELIILNKKLSEDLGLNFDKLTDEKISSFFTGNSLPKESEPIAQAYAGHQFGYFTMLGDGRAIVIGEHLTPNKTRVDIQFKGSGKTPYARGGDGRAALGPMLREYIISEAMYFLNIPTTRSLAVAKTGEDVIREKNLPGAILTRIAESHIRVGTFQYLAMKGNLKNLKSFVNYTIKRHFSKLINSNNPSLDLLKSVMAKQIDLILEWMRVGFIHGVQNTDNVAISGETIDYGPCAFMDNYDPSTVFSSIDYNGRYSYANQPYIAHWNLLRFGETLLPLINNDQKKAINIVEEVVNDFPVIFKKKWVEMMKKKLGLFNHDKDDEKLINTLLRWMEKNKADYTNTFCHLTQNTTEESIYKDNEFKDWYNFWKLRISKNKKSNEKSQQQMKINNPFIIPRNYKVEKALESVTTKNDLEPLNSLLEILQKPYDYKSKNIDYQNPSPASYQNYQTFCGT